MQVLTEIMNAARRLNINIVYSEEMMCDFQKGIINRASLVLNAARISCYFFHLAQNVYRRFQAEGFQQQYNDPDNREVKIYLHMLLTFAFVPVNDVHDCFEALRVDEPNAILPVLDYFDVNYISGQ